MFRYRRDFEPSPGNALLGILVLVMGFVALYFIASSIFRLLSWLAPVLLIITLIVDYKVVVNYFKWLWNTLQDNTLLGVGVLLLTIFGYPVVAGYLLMRALLSRQVRKMRKEQEGPAEKRIGEYIEYEEIRDETALPSLEEEEEEKSNEYDRFFGQ